jgi:quinol monooxygenase YgiN
MIPSCTLTATLHVRPETCAKLMSLVKTFLEPSRSEPDSVDYRLHLSADEPTLFYFYENWERRADLDRHLELPYQKEWFGRHKAFSTDDSKLKFFMLTEPASC